LKKELNYFIKLIVMKLNNNNLLLLVLLIISSLGYVVSCTHGNMAPPPPSSNTPVINRGNDVLLPGNMTPGDTSDWKMDKAHSSVLWSTNYVGAAGLLTGRFNQFGTHDVTDDKALNYQTTGQPLLDSSWAFYESEPSKTYFNGYVQINTSNTGEPSRDGGCNISNLGTVPIVPGTQNLTIQNLAKIKTTKVEFDTQTAGYIVTMDMTWQGKLGAPATESVTGTLSYIKRSVANGANYGVFGLQLKFEFNCRDFGITSTNISDKVDIECNINFNNQ
jgi:polyisoprenoid-binding protein YceI